MSKETITVCSACHRACCWQGVFYCDEHRSAGTVEMTRDELQRLNLEHPEFWDVCPNHGVARASCNCKAA